MTKNGESVKLAAMNDIKFKRLSEPHPHLMGGDIFELRRVIPTLNPKPGSDPTVLIGYARKSSVGWDMFDTKCHALVIHRKSRNNALKEFLKKAETND